MRQIRHTGIFVNDLERMKDFYCRYFNMNVAVHDTEVGDYIAGLYNLSGQKIEVELYKLITEDECMIELLKINPECKNDVHSEFVFNMGCAHVAFTVKDVVDLCGRLKTEGIRFLSEPLLSRDEKHKVCFCMDPEGNYLELVEEL